MIDNKLIRQLRQKRNMTLQDLSKCSGLSVSYLSEIELGKKQPSLETIEKLSQALNISRRSDFWQSLGTVGLGDKIALLRQEKDLSLSELAERVSPAVIYVRLKTEKQCQLYLLLRIAAALDVRTEDLMAATSFVGYKIKRFVVNQYHPSKIS